jgi:hypothetical protein
MKHQIMAELGPFYTPQLQLLHHNTASDHGIVLMRPPSNPPSLASGEGNASESSVIDQDDYPCGVPSFSPSITDVKRIQQLLKDKRWYTSQGAPLFSLRRTDRKFGSGVVVCKRDISKSNGALRLEQRRQHQGTSGARCCCQL